VERSCFSVTTCIFKTFFKIIHELNNPTRDYELQMVLVEKRIGNKKNPVVLDKLRQELNLRFESLSIRSESSN
jgi:hypothetical protein